MILNHLKSKDTEVLLVGSQGRLKYKNELIDLFSDIEYEFRSSTMLNNVDFKPDKNDYDLLCITDNIDSLLDNIDSLIDKTNAVVKTVKVDLITIIIDDIKYDIFMCKKKDKYYYFLFLILGKTANIILRQKVKRLGLKLNRYGLFNKDKKINIKFDNKLNIFYNIYIIFSYIYTYRK